jgi:hypothetical protein
MKYCLLFKDRRDSMEISPPPKTPEVGDVYILSLEDIIKMECILDGGKFFVCSSLQNGYYKAVVMGVK